MYKAILISPDGEDYVTDFERKTKEEVIKAIDNMGSRWYFYPIVGIIRSDTKTTIPNKRINIEGGIFDNLNGIAVKSLMSFIKDNQELVSLELQG